MPPTLRLETERLRLRPLAETDVDALVELDADPEVRRYVDRPQAPTRADVSSRLPNLLARYGPGSEPAYRAAERRDTGAFCGWFHLRPLDGDERTLDIGYRLRREAWGQGLASEGAAALIDRAFRELGAERVVGHALEENLASRRVLSKLGLRESARYLHRGELPAVAYAIEGGEFLRRTEPAG